MGNSVVDAVYDALVDGLSATYPDMHYYKYDPRSTTYERPFVGVQYRGYDTTNVPIKTIGKDFVRHLLELIIGVDQDSAELAEGGLLQLASDIFDIFKPWSVVNGFMVTRLEYRQERETTSRLADTAIIRMDLVPV